MFLIKKKYLENHIYYRKLRIIDQKILTSIILHDKNPFLFSTTFIGLNMRLLYTRKNKEQIIKGDRREETEYRYNGRIRIQEQ